MLAFMLNPQKVHDIGFREHVIDLVRNSDAQFFKLARNESARPYERDARAKLE